LKPFAPLQLYSTEQSNLQNKSFQLHRGGDVDSVFAAFFLSLKHFRFRGWLLSGSSLVCDRRVGARSLQAGLRATDRLDRERR